MFYVNGLLMLLTMVRLCTYDGANLCESILSHIDRSWTKISEVKFLATIVYQIHNVQKKLSSHPSEKMKNFVSF